MRLGHATRATHNTRRPLPSQPYPRPYGFEAASEGTLRTTSLCKAARLPFIIYLRGVRDDGRSMETTMKIQLLVIDIDGTLLNPAGEITAYTRAAVQAAQQAGIVVTLATARRYFNTVEVANELGLQGSIILYDGALIVQHPAFTVLKSRPLNASIGQEAVEILVRHGIQPVVHPDEGLTEEIWTGPAELDNLSIDAYFAANADRMRRMPYETLCTGHPDPLRVVAFTAEEAIEEVLPEISALDCSWNTIKRGSYNSAELTVMNKGCSKASAVTALAGISGIPLQAVMAIGDNNNDIEMLKTAGWGVAMGQASESVKAVANAVTASNWEDGAAQAIERYALRCAAQAASNSLNRATCL
jgi:5-amino-6-(5-phospho-D-ribitylamino)uracil phosphatase